MLTLPCARAGAEANTILDAFFLGEMMRPHRMAVCCNARPATHKFVWCCAGRAFAETVNERLGAALGDLLSEVTKLNAERDYAIRCTL